MRRAPPEALKHIEWWALPLLVMAMLAQNPAPDITTIEGARQMDVDALMRLITVRDHLEGRPLTDPVQTRIDWRTGVTMHWSPIGSAPIVWGAQALTPWLGRDDALMQMTRWWPVLLGGGFVAAMLLALRAAAAIIPAAPTPVLLAIGAVGTIVDFRPGAIDHHGLQSVLAALAIAGALTALDPRGRHAAKAACATGALLAIALVEGLEAAVPALAITTTMVWTHIVHGGPRHASTALYTLTTLTVCAHVLSVLTTPASIWLATHCDQISAPYLSGLAIATMLAAGVMAWEGSRNRKARGTSTRARALAWGTGATILAMWTLFAHPQCMNGPYAALPEILHTQWLDWIQEMRSTIELHAQGDEATALTAIGLPIAGLMGLAWCMTQKTGTRDPRLWLLGAVAVTGAVLVALQARGMSYAHMGAVLALAPLATQAEHTASRTHRILRSYALRVITPVTVVAISVMGIFAYTPKPSADQCTNATLRELSEIREPRRIAAPTNLAPVILWTTPHAVLAGNYHRGADGLLDNLAIYTGDETQAREAAQRAGIDTLVVCNAWPVASQGQGFIDELANGAQPPRWLEPMRRCKDPNACERIFDVRRSDENDGTDSGQD